MARFGSAGQQRSALILLDLAQVSIYNFTYEENPVLLIDDLDAELDRGRIEALLSTLEGRTQTFISTSRRAIANRYSDRASVFYVEQGRAMSERPSVSRSELHQHALQPDDELEQAVREMFVDEEGDVTLKVEG